MFSSPTLPDFVPETRLVETAKGYLKHERETLENVTQARNIAYGAAKAALMVLIANIRAALIHVTSVAEQSPATDRWKTLLDYIVARIIPRQLRKSLDTGPLWLANCGF